MKNFIEGYWPQKLIQCQKEYLVRIGSKNPTSLLLPRTQWKIWMIIWQLWTSIDNCLHETWHSIHPQEEEHLNNEISYEYSKGIDNLPPGYQPMFTTPLHVILNHSLHNKVSWIWCVGSKRSCKSSLSNYSFHFYS